MDDCRSITRLFDEDALGWKVTLGHFAFDMTSVVAVAVVEDFDEDALGWKVTLGHFAFDMTSVVAVAVVEDFDEVRIFRKGKELHP